MGGGTIAFNKLVILNLFQDLFFFIASFKYRFPIKTFGNDNLFTPILHHMLDKSESMVTITQVAKGQDALKGEGKERLHYAKSNPP